MELEEIMKKLEETVEKMEQSPLTLQESYQCFSQGMELVKAGNGAVDQVEKKIKILTEGENSDE